MDEERLIEKGFNHGYELQKRAPEIAVSMASSFSDPSKPYQQAFIEGSIECIKELGQDVSVFLQMLTEEKRGLNKHQKPPLLESR